MSTNIRVNIDVKKIIREYSAKRKKAKMMLKNEIIKDCDPFVPMLNGYLKNSPLKSIKTDDDFIVYNSPYARYQYYGILMVDPITLKGAFFDPDYGYWSRPGVSKITTSIPLHYSKGHHPKACSRWFEKGKTVYGKSWIEAARKVYKG